MSIDTHAARSNQHRNRRRHSRGLRRNLEGRLQFEQLEGRWLLASDLVQSEVKISDTQGAFGGVLDDTDLFGTAVASLGDLDGDGVTDLAVGAERDDDGGADRGAVWILLMNTDGTVKAEQKISDTEGGFGGALDNTDRFGNSLAGLGDLDGDSIPDLAVGAFGDDDGGSGRGAVWVLLLNADGTVKADQKISDTAGGFGGLLDSFDAFGTSLANLGDLDGDGVTDLAVGAERDDDGGTDRGAVWVLLMNADGTVKADQKISSTAGGFGGVLDDTDFFGSSVAGLGDLDGDGVPDLAVGARHDDDGGTDRGAVWTVLLNADGTVKAEQKISHTEGDFGGALDDSDAFGRSLASLGDRDGDGVPDLAVGARADDDGGTDRGAVWVLLMTTAGTVKSSQKISDTQGDFGGILDDADSFGISLASLGDLDGDGLTELAVGAIGDDDGGTDRGAVWVLSLGPVQLKISDTQGQFTGVLDNSDFFGGAVASLGDVDGDGVTDIAVGAERDDDGGTDRGAVWVLFMNADGTVKAHQKISDTEGGFAGVLDNTDRFGNALAGLGDLDGDGVPDVAVGAFGDDDGGSGRGAVWVLLLNADGTVKADQKISDTLGGFGGALDNFDAFGTSLANLGDLDSDGVVDLVVGAERDDDGGADRGAVWVLLMNADGTVKADQKISGTAGGFGGLLDNGDFFGASAAGLGDLDGDGVPDLAVGARSDDDGGSSRGAVWVLLLNADGTVKADQKISSTDGGFAGPLDDADVFGKSLAALGDLNGDTVPDLAVGARNDDDGGTDRGAVWVLYLNSDGTVKSEQKFSDTVGAFDGVLDNSDSFGTSLANLGDLKGDGQLTLAVGAIGDDDGGSARGAVWLVDLGVVQDDAKISDLEGDFNGVLDDTDLFGAAVASLGDLDGDGVPDMAVGAERDDDGGTDRGAIWVLFMNADGTVKGEQKISDTEGGFTGVLDNLDRFGVSLANLGDLDGDGVTDLAAGAFSDDDGGSGRGAVWVLFLNADGTVKAHQKISDTEGGFGGVLDNFDTFGNALATLGDLDGDGIVDLAAGAERDDDGGADRGAVWVLLLNSDGTVKAEQKISDLVGGFGGVLDNGDLLADSLAGPGDVDGDGIFDLAAGARGDDDGGTDRGAVWVLLLNADGTVKAEQKISDLAGGFDGVLDDSDVFGRAVAGLGDVDGDGVPDLAVGARKDDDGGTDRGAVWGLLLNPDGTVRVEQKVSDLFGGFGGQLDDLDGFGTSLAILGDLNGDGMPELAVGATGDDDGGTDRGAVWVLTGSAAAAPLLAAGAELTNTTATALQASALQTIVDAALVRFQQVGMSPAQLNQLRGVNFEIRSLPGRYLGLATPTTVRIDATAAGYGWYVDATPLDDSEFVRASGRNSGVGSPRSMDLLTVVMHEMGHILGLRHTQDASQHDLMHEDLAAGLRRTMTAAAVDAVFGRI